MKKCKRGFTLIELLVVLSIVSLMSSIVLVALNDARQKARDAAIKQSMLNLKTSIENYYTKDSTYAGICKGGNENQPERNAVFNQIKAVANAFAINPDGYGCEHGVYFIVWFHTYINPDKYACIDSLGGLSLGELNEPPTVNCPSA